MSERTERLLRELSASIREDIGALPVGVVELGVEIKAARAASRLSLEDVAQRSGFTKSHVWELEQGRARNPTVSMIAGLSEALGVPFQRLAQAALISSKTKDERRRINLDGVGRDPRPHPVCSETTIRTQILSSDAQSVRPDGGEG
jgi:transcriptional regulator with XRE-family HTH domain